MRRGRCCRERRARVAFGLRAEMFRDHRLHQRGSPPHGRRGAMRAATWITAARQTAGRGRRAREWESPSGNLFATPADRSAETRRRMRAALFRRRHCVADTVSRHAGGAEVRVKMAQRRARGRAQDRRHPAGIRLQRRRRAALARHRYRYQSRPPSGWHRVSRHLDCGAGPASRRLPAKTLGELASQFAKWYETRALRGFGPIHDAWLARAAGLGTRIPRAPHPRGGLGGVFEGIDDSGALLLRVEQGRVRSIAAGEVFF